MQIKSGCFGSTYHINSETVFKILYLAAKNVGEILFLKMEVGDKWTTGLSEATIAILPYLQDTLRNL